jgi:hypothetical protein
MSLLAATPAAGFTLTNGTPVIVSWTAPSDGKLHRVAVFASQDVTVATTGGQVVGSFNLPDGTNVAKTMFAATQGTGQNFPAAAGFPTQLNVEAGQTVSVFQNSAVTAGTAVVWVELWGS